MKPILRTLDLSKSFGTLQAVSDVSIEVFPEEVIGLAGLGGSGKSTLGMLLAGAYMPSAGQIFYNEKRLSWPFQARMLGIEIIHQEPLLVDRLDITSNIFLGSEIGDPRLGRWLHMPDGTRRRPRHWGICRSPVSTAPRGRDTAARYG
jgi:ABC-type sugar transport system ATPase subunit